MAVHTLSMHMKDVYLNMNNIKNSAILQIVEFLFLQKNRTYIRKIKKYRNSSHSNGNSS